MQVPEIGFITAPATFIEGIFSSDGLDTTLSDIASSINTLQNDITTMEAQITAQNTTIQTNFINQQLINLQQSASVYNTSISDGNVAWAKFNSGVTNNGETGNWTPASGFNVSSAQMPQAAKWLFSNYDTNYDINTITQTIGGFTTNPDGSVESAGVASSTDSTNSSYQTVLNANLLYFQANEFKNSYGSLINSTPGFNVANDIRAYNANIAQYYYEGIKQISYLYMIQKTSNILNYQNQAFLYAGSLSSVNGLSFTYSSGADASTNTALFESTQETLDNWAVQASNMLFQNTMQYVISDTPFLNQQGYNPPQPSYPYGATDSVQQYFTNTIFPNTVQTQSLWGLENNSGGMPQIQSANGVTSKNFVFYVESSIGNPYQYIPQYESAWENGQTMDLNNTATSIFATGPNGQGIPGYIANPGLYDGQNYQVWAINTAGGITQTALTNLNNRCSNGGSSLVSWTDWGNQGGVNYPPHTWGWSCPTNPNEAYIPNNIASLISSQEPSNDMFGLMSPSVESFVNLSSARPISITTSNTLTDNWSSWVDSSQRSGTQDAVINLVMNVGGYTFNPTFKWSWVAPASEYDTATYAANMYCGTNDPLCTIDPVTNQICVAGQVVGLNWINQGTFMFGAYVPGTQTQQHCYNS
ncbi:MAG: hypothetical protein K2Y14_08100 [Burkholderiales bacterium]|nr:hypothetical protein [Burkholderiales bacterium]